MYNKGVCKKLKQNTKKIGNWLKNLKRSDVQITARNKRKMCIWYKAKTYINNKL